MRTELLNAAQFTRRGCQRCESLHSVSCHCCCRTHQLASSGGLCPPGSLQKSSVCRLAQADSFLPFRSQLKCHFLRGSLDLCHWSHPRLFFPLRGTYHNAQRAHFFVCFLVLLPLYLNCKLQGTWSSSPLPPRVSRAKQAANKYFCI